MKSVFLLTFHTVVPSQIRNSEQSSEIPENLEGLVAFELNFYEDLTIFRCHLEAMEVLPLIKPEQVDVMLEGEVKVKIK